MKDLPQASLVLPLRRRAVLGGALAGTAMLTLPACTTMEGFSLVDAVRRLLVLSSERAFARMLQDGGYWEQAVATLGLPALLGTRGNTIAGMLTSTVFKNRLEGAFADIAREGAARAAPLVTQAVQVVGIAGAEALLRGGPTAATTFLRQNMGTSLVEAMVPELGQAMRIASEPLVAQLLATLTGVDATGAASSLAAQVDAAIWREIGVEETAIRANPRATNDPLLIAVLAAASAL